MRQIGVRFESGFLSGNNRRLGHGKHAIYEHEQEQDREFQWLYTAWAVPDHRRQLPARKKFMAGPRRKLQGMIWLGGGGGLWPPPANCAPAQRLTGLMVIEVVHCFCRSKRSAHD
jgi:hypothetical protein